MAREKQDAVIEEIREFLTTLEIPPISDHQKRRRFIAKATEFRIDKESGVLYKRNGEKPPHAVIMDPLQQLAILEQAHEQYGHRGVNAVYELMRNRFYWPRMRRDVQHHIRTCHECQIRSLKRMQVPITVSSPVTLFSKVFIDLMHMPKAKNMQWIAAARDDLSGTCEAQAIPNKGSRHLAKFFWEQIYCQYGAPRRVITDNGTEVKGGFSILLDHLKIPQLPITPYSHHGNGLVK